MNFQNFGKILAKMRKEKNMTQEELAEKLNVSSKTINGKLGHQYLILLC